MHTNVRSVDGDQVNHHPYWHYAVRPDLLIVTYMLPNGRWRTIRGEMPEYLHDADHDQQKPEALRLILADDPMTWSQVDLIFYRAFQFVPDYSIIKKAAAATGDQ